MLDEDRFLNYSPTFRISNEAKKGEEVVNTIPSFSTFNANGLACNNRVSARKEIHKLIKEGFVVCIQDSRIDKRKYRLLTSLLRANIYSHPRTISTHSPGYGDTTIIFP